MTDLERENMRLHLETYKKWEPLNIRRSDWPQFVGSVLIGIFLGGNVLGLGLLLFHILGRLK